MAKDDVADTLPKAAAPARKMNLPNHKDPGTREYLRIVRKAAITRRSGGKNEEGEDDVVVVPMNDICPVQGCGYPLVDRLKDEKGVLSLVPVSWTQPYLRMCSWDPEHFCEEVRQ